MTAEERVRVYCCFKACRICGAHRGEYCRAGRGPSRDKVWTRGYHYVRGPFADGRPGKAAKERYQKLKAQIEAQGEIPGHE